MTDLNKPSIIVLSSYTPSLFWYRIDMMKCFIDRGYDVYAVADQPESEWSVKFSDLGIKYKQIFIQRNGMNPFKDMRTIKCIVDLYREIKPHKVFTYQAKSTIYGGIAARIIGGLDVYPMIGGVGSIYLSNTLKARLIRTIVNFEYRIALRKSATVFFQNNDDLATFRDNKIIKNQKVCMISGSGVNTQLFYPMEFPNEISFLFTARLIKDKGIYEYLQACKMLKQDYCNVKCSIVGPYDTNPTAVTAEELKPYIDNSIIQYFGNQEDVRPFIQQSSVFVLPSYREGTPKAVLEAMSCGRAVITTDSPGCKETVVDGVNGYLVPVKDADAIYKKMKYFVENPDLVETMGKESRNIVEKKFDVRIVNSVICEAMGL